MSENSNTILIPVKGLPMGENSFSYTIDGKFFQGFENSQIKDADCTVKVKVVRHQTLLNATCSVGGFVVCECDRCLDDLTLKVDVERDLTVGFGNVDVDEEGNDEDVMIVDSSESEISLDQFVYDYVCLSLPLVKTHAPGKCNPEMLKYISKQDASRQAGHDGDTVSPFKDLKDMLNKKNN